MVPLSVTDPPPTGVCLSMKNLHSVLAAFACMVAGCGEPLAPASGDMFVLVAIGGDPLPAPTIADVGEIAIADTMIFVQGSARGGRVQRRLTSDYPTGVHHGVFEQEYLRERGLLVFLPPYCPPNANCAWVAQEGRFEADALVVTFADPKHRTRIYRKVP